MSNAACKAQADARTRFDGQPLSLEADFNQTCIDAYYAPSKSLSWGSGKLTTTPASAAMISTLKTSCKAVGDKLAGGKRDIVLVVANTPRKDELFDWLASVNAAAALEPYYISGTGTTVKVMKAKPEFRTLVDNFLPAAPGMHTESGPKGGDVQGTTLMAAGRVAAVIFFQSYQTECHKCDIQSMVQFCLGMQAQGEMECAFDVIQGVQVLKKLKDNCPKAPGQTTCRKISDR